MKQLFHHGQRSASGSVVSIESSESSTSTSSGSALNQSSGSAGESAIARADRFCKQLRLKPATRRRSASKPYACIATSKEVQKGLVVIDYQGENVSGIVPLREYEKIFDGCIRYCTDMSEDSSRKEIVRLVRQKKETLTHDFNIILPTDFDFVRCINRQVRIIDGDIPFDGNGISQIYKNGAIYVRLNCATQEY